MLAGTGSSSSAIETIFEEARIDPPPSTAAETIAALLYRHAETARQRSAAIQARLEAEEAAEAAVRAESRALEAEVSQYRGWISEELEGGAAYRLSKNLHDERDRCVALEEQVRGLKLHLAEMATELRALVQHAEQEPAEVVQQRAAHEVRFRTRNQPTTPLLALVPACTALLGCLRQAPLLTSPAPNDRFPWWWLVVVVRVCVRVCHRLCCSSRVCAN